MYPNINAERARRNMSVDELSKRLGISRKTYYNWMRNGKIPQPMLIKMSKMFNASVDYLLDTSLVS